MDSSLISGSSAFHTLTPEKRTRLNAPLNAAAFFSKRRLERAMIINVPQQQFSKICCRYGIRKSVQMLITVVLSQTSKLRQTSVTSLDKLSAASPKTNFRFFNSTVFTNPRITLDLVLNNITCDETTSPLCFAFKMFP